MSQTQPQIPAEADPRFAKPPKNLKVLRVSKPEDLRTIMEHFNDSLGVTCTFCHNRDDFSKETPHIGVRPENWRGPLTGLGQADQRVSCLRQRLQTRPAGHSRSRNEGAALPVIDLFQEKRNSFDDVLEGFVVPEMNLLILQGFVEPRVMHR